MSIIGDKYKGKYREADWIGGVIAKYAKDPVMKTVKTKVESETDGEAPTFTEEQVETGRATVNFDKLFDLAAVNGIDARGKYGEQAGRKNSAGRLAMTVGNMLRAAAKRRHGLNVPNGDGSEFLDAPAEFVGENARTENADGTKIAKAKPEAAPEAAEANTNETSEGETTEA